MVTLVKQDREVSIGFMKWYEKEKMLIRMGREEQEAETEKQRQRADAEKQRADVAEAELRLLKEKLDELLAQRSQSQVPSGEENHS